MSELFEKCPSCGGDLEKKTVEKVLRGGEHTAILKIQAQVCHHCGERLYDRETVERFEEIKQKLERKETSSFDPVGTAYKVN